MSARTGEPSCPPKTAKALQPVSHKKPLDPELNADACEKIGEWSPIISPPPTVEKKKIAVIAAACALNPQPVKSGLEM